MRLKLADLFTGVLAVSALTSAVVAVRRSTSADGPGPAAPTYVAGWRSIAGRPAPEDGADSAGVVTIVELSDFQCPFCAIAHSRIRRLQSESKLIHVFYRHRTLAVHPLAVPAAVASECARAQSRFDEFADVAFAAQAQLGSVSWDTLARRAGVPDLSAFAACQRSAAPLARVKADDALSLSIGVAGTPGILIRDSLWIGAPTESELRTRVERLTSRRVSRQ